MLIETASFNPINLQLLCHSFLHLKKTGATGPGEKPEQSQETSLLTAPGILCKYCRSLITEPKHGIEVQNAHQHEFINPHGFQFLIACFQTAQGCNNHGTPSDDFSWFAGYRWQYASCKHCQEHLGWRFIRLMPIGIVDHFFGLICDRLIFTAAEH